jgi:hypothetical protein
MDDLRKLVTCHIFETKPLKKVGRCFREQNDGLQAPLSCPFDAIADQIDSPIPTAHVGRHYDGAKKSKATVHLDGRTSENRFFLFDYRGGEHQRFVDPFCWQRRGPQ